jgi:predicted RNA-binding Zn-ribbon protein involved in translation (DUF1610 family)
MAEPGPHTREKRRMKTLRVEGVVEGVVITSLVEFRKELGKLKKKTAEKNLDVADIEEHDAAAKDALEQLGWKPTPAKGKGSRAEVVDTIDMFEPGKAAPPAPRVQCLTCSRNFAVPAGEEVVRACPDCGTIHSVKASEDGTVFRRRKLVTPPEDILALLLREKDPQLKKLSAKEKARLELWKKENPDYTTNPELVKPGDRVADPAVPGSGNPLRIDCSSPTLAGTECSGFDSTDTPGQAVCPKCGQKYVVSIELDGKPLVRLFDPADTGDVGTTDEDDDLDLDGSGSHDDED